LIIGLTAGAPVRNRTPFSALRWFSLLFILAGVILFTLQLVRFSRGWGNFPSGMTVAGISVGSLSRQQAVERLRGAYSIPVELYYGEAVIQLAPSTVGFELELDNMLAAAELERIRQPFWQAFWNYLWGIPSSRVNVPLRVNFSEERLHNYLAQEIAVRYDQAPTPALPVTGSVSFRPGIPGTSLDIERAIPLIEAALRSPAQRVVNLPLQRTTPGRPPLEYLQALVSQTLQRAEYTGDFGLYLQDLQSGQELNLLSAEGRPLPDQPDLAFSASSAIKIPLMVSAFRQFDLDLQGNDPDVQNARALIEEMIVKSSHTPADELLEAYLGGSRAPLSVTEDVNQLGLQNTFLSGFFFPGAPLLTTVKTQANQRSDLTPTPDLLSQTTPSEIGSLLADIYHCAHTGGGNLIAVFPGEITQVECQQMIQILQKNQISILIQAGVPDGIPVAHKHGWVPDAFGVIRDVSDAAVVYTPGGSYVLVIFLHHPTQLVWDPISKLVADLSRAVFNYYNLPSQ
jgi:beta-lactamase class A